jgi:hypothetical protein
MRANKRSNAPTLENPDASPQMLYVGMKRGVNMSQLTRRTFLATAAAATTARALPPVAAVFKVPPARRILTLVYDKSIGAMRAIDRLVP